MHPAPEILSVYDRKSAVSLIKANNSANYQSVVATSSDSSIASYPIDIINGFISEDDIYMLFERDLQTNFQNSVKIDCDNIINA